MRSVRGWGDPARFAPITCCSERVEEAVMARRRIGQERLRINSAGPRGGTSLDEVAVLVDWAEIDGLLVGISARAKGESRCSGRCCRHLARPVGRAPGRGAG